MADDVFLALAHPARRRLLELLADGPRTAGDLAAQFTLSRPAVAEHLQILRRAELVHDEAVRRPAGLSPAQRAAGGGRGLAAPVRTLLASPPALDGRSPGEAEQPRHPAMTDRARATIDRRPVRPGHAGAGVARRSPIPRCTPGGGRRGRRRRRRATRSTSRCRASARAVRGGRSRAPRALRLHLQRGLDPDLATGRPRATATRLLLEHSGFDLDDHRQRDACERMGPGWRDSSSPASRSSRRTSPLTAACRSGAPPRSTLSSSRSA